MVINILRRFKAITDILDKEKIVYIFLWWYNNNAWCGPGSKKPKKIKNNESKLETLKLKRWYFNNCIDHGQLMYIYLKKYLIY